MREEVIEDTFKTEVLGFLFVLLSFVPIDEAEIRTNMGNS